MILRDLLDLVSKEKRRQERVKTAQKFAIGMGVVAAAGVATGIIFAPKSGKETRKDLKNKYFKCCSAMKDTLHKKVEMAKDYAEDAEQKATDIIKDVAEKTEAVKKNIKESSHEIKEDVHKTAENISKELDKSV